MTQTETADPVDMIPSVSECFLLMDRYRMLKNIREHSIIVASIAEVITRALQEAGYVLALDLVIAGALLHDIGKTACLNSNRDHARKGRDICLAHGHDTIAEIVVEHVILAEKSLENVFSEKIIVYYADKRVKHDKVVNLEDRLEYILANYGNSDPAIHAAIVRNFKRCHFIEEKIFSVLEITPADVPAMIKKNNFFLANRDTR